MIQGDKVEILDTGNIKLITPKEDGDANVERKVDTIYQQPDSRLRVEIATETGDHMNTSSLKAVMQKNSEERARFFNLQQRVR